MNKFFKKSEFACKCGCGFNDIDRELIWILTAVRIHFGKPVIITSGCRCEKHNKVVGGASKSFHVQGMAADIQVKGIDPKTVQAFLCDLLPSNRYGIGYANTFTHIDTRSNGARFNY